MCELSDSQSAHIMKVEKEVKVVRVTWKPSTVNINQRLSYALNVTRYSENLMIEFNTLLELNNSSVPYNLTDLKPYALHEIQVTVNGSSALNSRPEFFRTREAGWLSGV